MGKGVYLGSGGVKQSKKIFIGAGGVKKVKKIFGGVAGLVKLMYSGDVAFIKELSDLSFDGTYVSGGSVGNYMIILDGGVSAANAYNSSLVKVSNPQGPECVRTMAASASIGNYCLFYGGGGGPYTDTYDTNLARGAMLYNYNDIKNGPASARTNNHAIFACGSRSNDDATVSSCVAYSASLTISHLYMNNSRYHHSGASVGGYAVFIGGMFYYNGTSYPQNSGEAFNSSLVRSDIASPNAPSYGAAGQTSNYAIFAGGQITYTPTNTVFALDSSLVKINAPALSSSVYWLKAISVDDCVVFAGGGTKASSSPPGAVTMVDMYDNNLVKTQLPPLAVATYLMASASAGSVGIFAGGQTEIQPRESRKVYAYGS